MKRFTDVLERAKEFVESIKFEKGSDIRTLLHAQANKKLSHRYEIIRDTDKRILTQSVMMPTGRTPEIPVSGPSSFSNHR